jgi:RHS repeat-associated protein
VPLSAPVVGDNNFLYDSLTFGGRVYELSNHLGNVLVTISDKKIQKQIGIKTNPGFPPTNEEVDWPSTEENVDGPFLVYVSDVISATDYYPFGMQQPGRQFSVGNYRYGFNGKEMDNEVKGDGNQQEYGMRIYDPRLGRFLSVDPLAKDYPWYSPYHFAGNNPIQNKDLDGGEPQDYRENWVPVTMSPTKGGKSEYTAFLDDPVLGMISYEAYYDKTTTQHWFVHQNNNGQYYYWKLIQAKIKRGKSSIKEQVKQTEHGLFLKQKIKLKQTE